MIRPTNADIGAQIDALASAMLEDLDPAGKLGFFDRRPKVSGAFCRDFPCGVATLGETWQC